MKALLIVTMAAFWPFALCAQANWGPYRGMNAAPAILTRQDVQDFARTGGNLLRLSMPQMPFMIPVNPSYSGKLFLDTLAFAKMDEALGWCEEYGVKAVIDPHTFPGQNMLWTMLGYDTIWKDLTYHQYIITTWEAIAQRYANRGSVIAGYDLLNEPFYHEVFTPGGANDLNHLYKKIIQAIRKKDTSHTIIVAAPYYWDTAHQKPVGYTIGIKYLEPVTFDDNIVYEVHFYEPDGITNGVLNKDDAPPYPGFIDDAYWNHELIAAYFQNTIAFQQRYNATIYLGEFSSPRWLAKYGANSWGLMML